MIPKSKFFTSGFSFVELMIAVAVLGILAAVAVPSYNKHKAKARTVEAKINLASLYSIENGARSTYGTYASCLKRLGLKLDPAEDRFYLIGFGATGDNVEDNNLKLGQPYAGNLYLQNKFNIKDCVSPSRLPEEGNHYFKAGKKLPGTNRVCYLAHPTNRASCIPINDTEVPDPFNEGKVLTRSATTTRKDQFTAMAAGYIFAWKEDDKEAKPDMWIINEKKQIGQVQEGY